ncbi:hypothetical protein H8S90_03460 [Olivibacter sp. SDN3]|uniref:hypothetical protein n=1 Tax=Olivibacter sp. SDN3 TaxID=2764720 RepID=UPI0016510531|nr:hypothetical protein [Olivibacter sp. SDN3]QNL50670.1 hypothetical protein H8S90_03460 [Olivibacter sp. SDN3]
MCIRKGSFKFNIQNGTGTHLENDCGKTYLSVAPAGSIVSRGSSGISFSVVRSEVIDDPLDQVIVNKYQIYKMGSGGGYITSGQSVDITSSTFTVNSPNEQNVSYQIRFFNSVCDEASDHYVTITYYGSGNSVLPPNLYYQEKGHS